MTADGFEPAPKDSAEPEGEAGRPVRLKAWSFTTEGLPVDARQAAWREVLTRLRLPLGRSPEAERFAGSVACLSSPLGMDFAVMAATPQEISGRNPDQPSAVWIVVLLDGEARFSTASAPVRSLRAGDIIYGPTGTEASLDLLTPFRLLFINAPRVALAHRLLAPQSLKVGCFAGDRGLGQVFSGLLQATAKSLADLSFDQLRPIELAVTEFLLANLAADGSAAAVGGAEAARAAHLHRVCQTIETLLSDADLTLERVAAADGVAPRSVQKLFTGAGLSFTTYLKNRRLERCRLDLESPVCASLSISEICFRWGFNGSAHFSRSFKEHYGCSPRAYRRQALGLQSDAGGEEP